LEALLRIGIRRTLSGSLYHWLGPSDPELGDLVLATDELVEIAGHWIESPQFTVPAFLVAILA
jgi:hypothetical protein